MKTEMNSIVIGIFISIAALAIAENNNKDNYKNYQTSTFTPTYDLIGWTSNTPFLLQNTNSLLNSLYTIPSIGQIPYSGLQSYQNNNPLVLQDAFQRQVLPSVALYPTLNQLQSYPITSTGGGSNSQINQFMPGSTTFSGGYPIGYYRQTQVPITGSVQGGMFGGAPQPGIGVITTSNGQGALGSFPHGSIVGGHHPGSFGGFPPGFIGGYGQGIPGAHVPGSFGGNVPGSLGFNTHRPLGGFVPGSFGGNTPGNFGGYFPGSLVGGLAPGSFVGGYTPGPLTGGYTPGPFIGGYAPGSLVSGYAPGFPVGGYAPGSIVGGHAPVPYPGGYAPGSVIGGFSPGPQSPAPIVGNYGQGLAGGMAGSFGGHAPGSLVNPGSQGNLGATSLGSTISNSLVPGHEKANIHDYANFGNDFQFAGYDKPILNSGELQKKIQDLLLNRETKPIKKDKERLIK